VTLPDDYVVTCQFCDEPVAGQKGTWYSLTTSLETCAKSFTTFHEVGKVYCFHSGIELDCAGCLQGYVANQNAHIDRLRQMLVDHGAGMALTAHDAHWFGGNAQALPAKTPAPPNDKTCCEANVPKLSFTRPNGESWQCPACQQWWVWGDDEAEGGAWWPLEVVVESFISDQTSG
jgi:hypothetical protein